MASNKPSKNSERHGLEPRRRPGKERVAALLEAAAKVIAEKGYEVATMAEIAAHAGALVGSLYHFFPNKEVLADALIDGSARTSTKRSPGSMARALQCRLTRWQTPWLTC